MVINPTKIGTAQLHQLLVGGVAPRPIAFVSTLNENGKPNLAPYSFFNVFSSNPPILVFSSNRKVSDNTTKDTLHNVIATREVVINVVSHDIVHQMAVTSVGYPSDINEFEKAGLTPVAAQMVKPFRVAESPMSFECVVKDIVPLGDEGGAGHLVVCQVVCIHVKDEMFDDNGVLDPHRLDQVARMGRAFYTRANQGIFKVFQDLEKIAIGFDQLPADVQQSEILSGNHLGRLAGLLQLPTEAEVRAIETDERIAHLLKTSDTYPWHRYAKATIDDGDPAFALKVLMLRNLRK